MNINICSRKAANALLTDGFPANTAVISFCSPDEAPVDYGRRAARTFLVFVRDIDIETLPHYGLSFDAYFPEAPALAEYIRNAVRDGLDILCQCDYGQSRSAACCAAILEHYEKNGISIFADYRYYPNQLVFNKLLDALKALPQK